MQKKIIIALIVLGIIISILINNKISEARIQNILNLTSNNNTSEYFKKLISENENIDYNIIDNLKDISKLKEKINNEITKYSLNTFDFSFALFDVELFEAINKRYDYIKYLNNLLEDINI